MGRYNVSPTVMGRIPPKGLVMAKRWTISKIVQFEVECDFVQYESKVETIKGIDSLNFFGENNLKGVQKPS